MSGRSISIVYMKGVIATCYPDFHHQYSQAEYVQDNTWSCRQRTCPIVVLVLKFIWQLSKLMVDKWLCYVPKFMLTFDKIEASMTIPTIKPISQRQISFGLDYYPINSTVLYRSWNF